MHERGIRPDARRKGGRGNVRQGRNAAADPAALASLIAASGDKDSQIRDAAIRALALRALVRLTGDLNAKSDTALIARYRQLLAGAQTADDRRLILSALAGASDPAALDLALGVLSDPAVRAETELTVRKIAAKVRAEHPEAALAKLKPAKKPAPKK
jgi:hypothetical protein